MNRKRNAALLVAYLLVTLVFLLNSIGIVDQSEAVRELVNRGVPSGIAPGLMLAGRAVELLGSLGLVFGFYRRFAIAGLIAFLIAATYVGHPFWLLASTPQFTPQLINFLKNLAIMGGLFYIASIDSLVSAPGFRAQPISLKQVEHAD